MFALLLTAVSAEAQHGPGKLNNTTVKPNTSIDPNTVKIPMTKGYTTMKLRLPFSKTEVEYEVRKEDHYYILNDDIIVGNDFFEAKSYSTDDKDYKWYNAEIPVVIDKSIFDNKMQYMVVKALNAMNAELELSIVPRTNQKDYIRIQFYTPSVSGAAGESVIGRQGGEQPLFLASSATQGTVWHELFHAAGIYHEQSRDDRNNFIHPVEKNMKDGASKNFQIEPGNANGGYDYCSIMHYSSTAFSKNGQTTIECLKNGSTTPCPACMGQRNEFTAEDRSGLDRFYNEVSRFPSQFKFVVPQESWRYCNKCHAMFYDGYYEKGSCPAKGQHEAAGYNFVLPHEVPGTPTAQSSWRYCSKCYLMFYDGYAQKGACAKGDGHTAAGFNFVLPHDVPGTPTAQNSWRFCNKCQTMFYDGYPQKGVCAAGGGHIAAGYNFVLPHEN
jgi:hypothetical protein